MTLVEVLFFKPKNLLLLDLVYDRIMSATLAMRRFTLAPAPVVSILLIKSHQPVYRINPVIWSSDCAVTSELLVAAVA